MAMNREQEARIVELLAGPDADLLKLWSSGLSDKRVTQAIATYQMKNPATDKLQESLEARLRKIEAAADRKVKALEMSHAVKLKALQAGVNPALLEGIDFPDESAIDERIALLQSERQERDTKLVNEVLARDSYKPGGGNGSGDGPRTIADLKKMTRDEIVALGNRRVNEVLRGASGPAH